MELRPSRTEDLCLDAEETETLNGKPGLAEETVLQAVRQEMARNVEDVLARRTRTLFLDARRAIATAPQVAALMAPELQRNAAWQAAQVESFTLLAQSYLWNPGSIPRGSGVD
jgi:glycerol-3-phosphate dehydrogenase